MEKKFCKCGHSRGMHETPRQFESGQAPPKIEKDVACTATIPKVCGCEAYVPKDEE